ncbi:MAG: general secretion pathway protein GspK [Phycisphaerales bacterium]
MKVIINTNSRRQRSRTHSHRRGSVVVVVLWAVALGAIITAAAQISAHRQATLGLQSLARVEARWAARAGVEHMINTLGYYTENPDTTDAYVIYREMGARAYSEPDQLLDASWAIEHTYDGQVFAGPMDEHTRFNVNLSVDQPGPLLNLFVPEDIIACIQDWIDEDDDLRIEGAEESYYLSLGVPYAPRNNFMRNMAELELVYGLSPEAVRGEDWNLNNRLDAAEDDGSLLWPPDNADGILQPELSKYLTTYSVAGGLSPTGQPRIFVPESDPDEIAKRCDISIAQAEAIFDFGNNPSNTLPMLWTAPLSYINPDGTIAPFDTGENGQGSPPVRPNVESLTFEQYEAIFGELTLDDPSFRLPGKININVAPAEVFTDVLLLDPAIADQIILQRQRSAQGFTSLVQLTSVSPVFSAPTLADLGELMDVQSNVFTITSTGRSETTGFEVQLIVVVDRSTLPVHILEYREQ